LNPLNNLLHQPGANRSVSYRDVDYLFRDRTSKGELDAFLAELERTGAEVRAADKLDLADAEKIDREGGEPLHIYLQEVARVPAVSAEREVELLQVIQDDAADALFAKKELVEANLGLVVSIARSYCAVGLNILDLIERGNLGLFEAVDSFESGGGYRFSTYATLWVHRHLNELIFSGSVDPFTSGS
jgi:RNA polymerase primary sigma factor